MKIAVIGASGKAGSLIAAEAKKRGHEVTAIVRPASEAVVSGKYPVIAKDLFDLAAADLGGFDAVVNAFGSDPGFEYKHIEGARHLISVFEQLPEVRILFVGGAGSLWKDESREHLVMEDIPPMFRSIPVNQKMALDEIRKSSANWTFFSPAATFDYMGLRTGKYELGTEYQIKNKVGASYISYADYAVAMVDEIENNAHPRQRFTAVSCNPYFNEAPQYLPVGPYVFSARGAWYGLQADTSSYGTAQLFLMTMRSRRLHSGAPNHAKLYSIKPTFGGNTVPFSIQNDKFEYTLHTMHGDVRFTWANGTTLIAEGDEGMGLHFAKTGESYEIVKPRKGGAWESSIRQGSSYLFTGIEGSEFYFEDTWNYQTLRNDIIRGFTKCGENGKFTLAIEEFPYAAKVHGNYPSYAEAKASMQKSFEEFYAKMPAYIAPFEAKREETAYVLWSHLVAANETTPHEMIMMFPGVIASQWQLIQNAVALQDNTDLALQLMLAPLDRRCEATGQLADMYDEAMLSTTTIKPAITGWAFKNIMAHRDIAKCWPMDKIEEMYKGYGAWADWFMECRDDDEDGLPSFEGGNENGFDESTIYLHQVCMATPDLCAYEVLNFEAQGDLAKVLGKPQEEIDSWYKKSSDLLQRMIDKMWDGEHFVGLKEHTLEPHFSGSNVYYQPLILGSRLPKDILKKMVADLWEEGGLLSKYGIASERPDSDYYMVQGVLMGRGTISPPCELFITTGLWEAGEKELAREIIDRYCGHLMKTGFAHFYSPTSGAGSPMHGTWCRCTYAILCRMISED